MIQDLAEQSEMMDLLRAKVRSQLLRQKEHHERLKACGSAQQDQSFCARTIPAIQAKARQDWPVMRTALALSSPVLTDPHARENRLSWYHPRPRHLMRGGASLKPLTATESNAVEASFLEQVSQSLPELRSRIDREGGKISLLGANQNEIIRVNQEMVSIRSNARENYVGILGQNPILFFLDDVKADSADSPSVEQIRSASGSLLQTIDAEIERLKLKTEKWTPDELADRRLFEYTPLIEELLTTHPHLCRATTVATESARKKNQNDALKRGAAQIGVSILALSTCSTGIGCGLVAGVVAATDYAIARNDATEAIRNGLAQAAVAPAATALSEADAAHRSENATLAMVKAGAIGSGAKYISSLRLSRRGGPMASWNPSTRGEMEHYFLNHVREVRGNAMTLYQNNQSHFRNLPPETIKGLLHHDGEKFMSMSALKEKFGYKGVPKDIVEGLNDSHLSLRRFPIKDGHVEMSLSESLFRLWGHSPQNLETKLKAARTPQEKKHWESMLKLRNHVVDTMGDIDNAHMRSIYRTAGSPEARVELRMVEMLADLSARKSNPITANEMGRPILSTDRFLVMMKEDGIAKKIADPSSPAEQEAAKNLVQRIGLHQIRQMASEAENLHRSTGVPTSFSNMLINTTISIRTSR
jgi:hypothetical protein